MKLPLKMPWELAQTRWASILEPIINFAISQSGQSGKILSTNGYQTKWIPASEVTGIVGISSGGTGEITQAAAITALAGTQSSGHYLRSNGTNTVLSAIQAGDIPTLNQNTTGTASNVTATSNSTLTTLSVLSLPTSQLSGAISLTSQVSGTLPIVNGGTGQTTANTALNALLPSQTGNSGKVLSTDGTNTNWAASGGSLPSGSIMPFAGSSAPTGFLLCDGSAVSRTTYANLFAVTGTTFGVGDGSTTFNVPDLRGIFIRGAGTNSHLSNANGTAFSGTLGTYQNDKMQGHRHTPQINGASVFSAATGTPGANNVNNTNGNSTGGNQWLMSTPNMTDGTNGTPRTGAETNPANLGLNHIIAI